jgi:hypothetical protein
MRSYRWRARNALGCGCGDERCWRGARRGRGRRRRLPPKGGTARRRWRCRVGGWRCHALCGCRRHPPPGDLRGESCWWHRDGGKRQSRWGHGNQRWERCHGAQRRDPRPRAYTTDAHCSVCWGRETGCSRCIGVKASREARWCGLADRNGAHCRTAGCCLGAASGWGRRLDPFHWCRRQLAFHANHKGVSTALNLIHHLPTPVKGTKGAPVRREATVAIQVASRPPFDGSRTRCRSR